MTIKMTNKARRGAKRLALRYAWWCEAYSKTDLNGMAVWGSALLQTQETMGIELANPENVRNLIGHARCGLATE